MKPFTKSKPKEKAYCLICGEHFTKERKWQTYCSRKCKNKNFWRTHKIVKATDVETANV